MNKALQDVHDSAIRVKKEIHKRIEGMDDVIDGLIITTFAAGHALLEGVPGTGKTYLINTIAEIFDLKFTRVQMTPDMVPRNLWQVADVAKDGKIILRPGPIFTNILLADEMNRTSPRTQSALLEAMQEGQVTLETGTEPLPKPFLVFATQNPIETEGTYPLAEAQKDRFLMWVFVGYPEHEESIRITNLPSNPVPVEKIMDGNAILHTQQLIEEEVRIDPVLREKAVTMAELTRPEDSEIARGVFSTGASTRAPMALVKTARVIAVLRGRDYVLPEDLISLTRSVFYHRVVFEDAVLPNDRDAVFNETMQKIVRAVFGWEVSDGQRIS